MKLYPLKFAPIYKEKIWGGNYHTKQLNRNDADKKAKIGESWEISSVEGDISVVTNGELAGNGLDELIEVYMGDLVGDKVYDQFGTMFPILVKIIDAHDDLSVQVHPNDEIALEKHESLGKTEMWYILDSEPEATIVTGFSKQTNRTDFEKLVHGPEVLDVLNTIHVEKNEVYFIPAGCIHALGKGVVVVEIQETSDITYRVYDYNRKDDQGNERDLHVADALEVIDFTVQNKYDIDYKTEMNKPCNLVRDWHFTTNMVELNTKIGRDYFLLDSFVVVACIEGSLKIHYPDGAVTVALGEFALIPNELKEIMFEPMESKAKFLEVYFEGDDVNTTKN